jgi:serine/threonine protein kinase
VNRSVNRYAEPARHAAGEENGVKGRYTSSMSDQTRNPPGADDATILAPANAAGDPDVTVLAPAGAGGDADATIVVNRPAAAVDDDATKLVQGGPGREAPTSGSREELHIGSIINRRFVIEGVLGRGGMGVVYRAKDLRKEETGDRDPYVALKVLSGEFRLDPKMVIALQRESRKAQTLAHPNIATVYDFDRDGDIFYLTMEQLDGKPLNEVIADHPEGMPLKEALPIIRGLCLGLAYAHNKGIIHSDFKPGNVFFTSARQTRILDFGIARAAPVDRGGANAQASDITTFDAGELGALTPSYASREMFEGQPPHPADDVYALAIVAYQLLTGRHPFNSVPAPQARNQKLEPQPIKGLSRRQWRAIRHGLAFDRPSRSQHAAEFLRELEGGSAVKIVGSIAVMLAIVFAGYVGYVQVQESTRAAPDIPFEQLPTDIQTELKRLLSEGSTLRRFDDPGSALTLYRDAYALHPRNKEVVVELEALLVDLAARTVSRGNRAELTWLRENFGVVMKTDDFLGNRPALVRARQEVDDALATAR